MSTFPISALFLPRPSSQLQARLPICASAQTRSESRVNGIIVTSTLLLL
jgi:hypothetical protein